MNRPNRFKTHFFLLCLILSGWACSLSAQDNDASGIEWLTLEEALERSEEAPRMIFIDFYTDWCGWCKKMDVNTFANPQIAALMNEHYYAVKFNAEDDTPIVFQGREYVSDTTGRRPAHGIAVEMASHNGRLGYPTFVVLNSNWERLRVFPGYKTVDALKQILEYYSDESVYTRINWMEFIQGYQTSD